MIWEKKRIKLIHYEFGVSYVDRDTQLIEVMASKAMWYEKIVVICFTQSSSRVGLNLLVKICTST